ncbi:MAG: type III pantothenate kinase [Bacteroidetes bacterium]|nr:type III pantothenate kinase [Bacteroidota bacterium]
MNAAIDVGNTNTKIGIFNGAQLVEVLNFPTLPLQNLYKHLDKYEFAAIIVATVVALPEHIISYLKGKARNCVFFQRETHLPITIKYKSTDTLGQDRIALAAGAQNAFPKENVLVISAGTCNTYDFINAKGEYLGGAISPGIMMRLKALNQFTDKLPLIELPNKVSLIGQTTEESIASGVINGVVNEIEGFITDYNKKYSALRCILSGGDGRYISQFLKTKTELIPELTLTGLNKILQTNAS